MFELDHHNHNKTVEVVIGKKQNKQKKNNIEVMVLNFIKQILNRDNGKKDNIFYLGKSVSITTHDEVE